MTTEELYQEIGGNYSSAKRILQMDRLIGKFILKFRDDKSFDRLMAGWEQKDGTAIFEGAHALKGVCANLGLDDLSAAASEIAEEYRSGGTPSLSEAELESKMENIRSMHQRIIEGIDRYKAG